MSAVLFLIFSSMSVYVERKDIGAAISRLCQVCTWWESQDVGIVDTLTKTVLHFLHTEKEPEVKAIDPIIFRKNCQIWGEGCISIQE